MFEGQIVTYRIRVAPLIWSRWVTEIKAVVPELQFIDEQRGGPYRFWHHLHRFEAIEGGTLISDEVNYALPFGPLGNVVHSLYVRSKVRRIFDFRREELARRFGEVCD
jgi:ligand-binding SRPBCC domain-containing protein